MRMLAYTSFFLKKLKWHKTSKAHSFKISDTDEKQYASCPNNTLSTNCILIFVMLSFYI